jgi:hypothetical protein
MWSKTRLKEIKESPMQTNSTYKTIPIQSRKVQWQNLSFSSVSEVKIAQALAGLKQISSPNKAQTSFIS